MFLVFNKCSSIFCYYDITTRYIKIVDLCFPIPKVWCVWMLDIGSPDQATRLATLEAKKDASKTLKEKVLLKAKEEAKATCHGLYLGFRIIMDNQ